MFQGPYFPFPQGGGEEFHNMKTLALYKPVLTYNKHQSIIYSNYVLYTNTGCINITFYLFNYNFQKSIEAQTDRKVSFCLSFPRFICHFGSVADPVCLSRIRIFSHPGSRISDPGSYPYF